MTESTAQLVQFRVMGRYNALMNRRLYEVAAQLSDDERKRDLQAFFGSVHGTLNHLLLTDRHWLWRLSTKTPHRFRAFDGAQLIEIMGPHARELYADFAALRAAREETDATLIAWLDETTPDHLAAPMRYSNLQGTAREHPLWFAVAHLLNHQTHHRSQATTLLHQLGRDYGGTDLIAFDALLKETQ